jgi:hypothetical protein
MKAKMKNGEYSGSSTTIETKEDKQHKTPRSRSTKATKMMH